MRPKSSLTKFLRTAALAGAALGVSTTATAIEPYGNPGEPINLTIGYQPYYTQAWSAVIMKEKEFWKNYLPEGSTVSWEIGLQGAIIGNAMLAGKHDIGYMGDMPTIVAVSKSEVRDLRIVSTLGLAYDQCSVYLARNEAPELASPEEMVKWWDGKRIAVAKGSCTDRSGQGMMKKYGIEPAAYLNQNIEVQTSGFKAGKLDGSIMWEPTASKIVMEGLAKRIGDTKLNGENGELDGGFMAMQTALIEQRPDVAKGWLEAELDANLFWNNPENYMEVVEMAHKNTQGFSKEVLWMSMAGKYPAIQGGSDFRNIIYYGFDKDVFDMIGKASAFLHEIKAISMEQLPEEKIMSSLTDEILKERGLTVPLGRIIAQEPSEFPEGPIQLPATWRE